MSVQKFVRGHQARSIVASTMQLDSTQMSIIGCDSPTKQEALTPSPRSFPSDEPVCGHDTLVSASTVTGAEIMLGADKDNYATIIQRWYRNENEIRVAALLVTRVVRKFLGVKKAEEKHLQLE